MELLAAVAGETFQENKIILHSYLELAASSGSKAMELRALGFVQLAAQKLQMLAAVAAEALEH